MNRRPPPSPQIKDIFGTWVPLVALMASKTKPLPLTRHDPMIERLERAYGDMATASTPSVQSWRDLTDMQNFLQSLVEMGWAEDEGEHSYWQTVSHVKRRIEKLRRGARRNGDIVVSL